MNRILLLLLLVPLSALAHPGIGIVKNSAGAIFYTDLKQVWKIEPNGKKRVVVPNVHTHELYLDSQDNLFGEHLWYNGERLDTWGHYVWRLSKSGVLDTVKGPLPGFLEEYSFVRDGRGKMYWAEQYKVTRIRKKTPGGAITTLAEGHFKDIRWMHATERGELYFVNQENLYRIDPDGKLKQVAQKITRQTAPSAGNGKTHALFGVWTDKDGSVYVADYTGQVVKRVKPSGAIEVVVYSTSPWATTGGVFDDRGNLWLLEASFTNDVRVRKVLSSEIGKKKSGPVLLNNYLTPIEAGLALISLIVLIAWMVFRRPRLHAV